MNIEYLSSLLPYFFSNSALQHAAGDHFVSVLTIIKSAVRDMGLIARDSSENIIVLASKQQRLAAAMRDLSGHKISSTSESSDLDSRNGIQGARRFSTGTGTGTGGRVGVGVGSSPVSKSAGVSPKSARYPSGSGTGSGPGSAVKGSNGLSPLSVQPRPMLSSIEGNVM